MLESVLAFPSQVNHAFTVAKSLNIDYDKISDIVVLGMGGSGIVGDYLRVLLRNSSLPFHVNKHSIPPKSVGKNTLVMAVTYSGKTRETLDALDTCMKVGAKVVLVTSKRELDSMHNEGKVPCITIPENSQSRASLGYMLVPLLYLLQDANVLNKVDRDITETVEVLNQIKDECKPEVPLKKNPARSLASELLGRFPIIYGEYNFTDAVAMRWKHMLNENAKTHCYHDTFPELLHNEIEAWDEPESNEKYALVLLRDSLYERETGLQERIAATKYIVQQRSKIFELWTRGRSELARLLSLTYLGDLTSVYLAKAKGVDASKVRNIELLKNLKLKEMVADG
jgi:glucose/mannose-6-phosphate isomerase